VIPQGVRLQQLITLSNVNQFEIGLFVATLRQFAMNPLLGAKTAHHCGTVSGAWDVKSREGIRGRATFGGTVAFDAYGDLAVEDAFLLDCEAAFEERLKARGFDFRAPKLRAAPAEEAEVA